MHLGTCLEIGEGSFCCRIGVTMELFAGANLDVSVG